MVVPAPSMVVAPRSSHLVWEKNACEAMARGFLLDQKNFIQRDNSKGKTWEGWSWHVSKVKQLYQFLRKKIAMWGVFLNFYSQGADGSRHRAITRPKFFQAFRAFGWNLTKAIPGSGYFSSLTLETGNCTVFKCGAQDVDLGLAKTHGWLFHFSVFCDIYIYMITGKHCLKQNKGTNTM